MGGEKFWKDDQCGYFNILPGISLQTDAEGVSISFISTH